jgi:hypothetical protein
MSLCLTQRSTTCGLEQLTGPLCHDTIMTVGCCQELSNLGQCRMGRCQCRCRSCAGISPCLPISFGRADPGLEATPDAKQRKLAAICDNSRHKRGRAASLTMLIHPCQLLARLALKSLWRVSAK